MNNGPSQLIVAAMAFAGATLAQIANHLIQWLRERSREFRDAQVFVDLMIADLDYAAMNMATVLHLLEPHAELNGWFTYNRKGSDIILIDVASTHYKPNISVSPSLVNRVRQRLQVANETLKEIKEAAPCSLDPGARFRMIDLFAAVSRLSVVLEKTRGKGKRKAGWTEDVSQEEVIQKWGAVRVTVGTTRISPEDVSRWFADLNQARASR
jgi:hypothetical protein